MEGEVLKVGSIILGSKTCLGGYATTANRLWNFPAHHCTNLSVKGTRDIIKPVLANFHGWAARVDNDSQFPVAVQVTVICRTN